MIKEKTAPSVASTESGAGTIANCEDFADPFTNYSGLFRLGQCVKSLLPEDKRFAVTAKQLAEMMKTDHRSVTREIERLRKSGVPICATSDASQPGYYLTNDPAELERYLQRLRRRIKNVSQTERKLTDTLLTMSGQTEMRDE